MPPPQSSRARQGPCAGGREQPILLTGKGALFVERLSARPESAMPSSDCRAALPPPQERRSASASLDDADYVKALKGGTVD